MAGIDDILRKNPRVGQSVLPAVGTGLGTVLGGPVGGAIVGGLISGIGSAFDTSQEDALKEQKRQFDLSQQMRNAELQQQAQIQGRSQNQQGLQMLADQRFKVIGESRKRSFRDALINAAGQNGI